MPEELWMELHDTVQEAVIKIIPMGGEEGVVMHKAKGLSEKALQIAVKRRDLKGK